MSTGMAHGADGRNGNVYFPGKRLMASAALLACDWGTTNLRAWTLDAAGAVTAEAEFPLGVSRLGPGEASRRFEAEVRPDLKAERLPAILCGMIGSTLGWALAPYADCPAGLPELARAALQVAPQVRIIPGLRCTGLVGAPDVMRGEETQVLGWLAQYPERQRGRHLICHPGTHAKWVVVEDGRIARFVTAMTGELFAVLTSHSVLKHDSPPTDAGAFAAGVAAAGPGDALAARLFSARSRVVGGDAPAESTPSYLSGLLIGAEVATVPQALGKTDSPVVLLGDAALCSFYRRALEVRQIPSETFDGQTAAIAGLLAVHRMKL
jgi:2-dehydro-3-deoxygalactonokinase